MGRNILLKVRGLAKKVVEIVLKQRVIIRGPAGYFAGKEGIIVAVKTIPNNSQHGGKRQTVCKLLIEDSVSNWLPIQWLEIVERYSTSA